MKDSTKTAPGFSFRSIGGQARRGFSILLLAGMAAGCQFQRAKQSALGLVGPGLSAPLVRADLDARVTPPVGWTADPTKVNGSRVHQTWLSPSGNTAYGVVHFHLPLPLSASFVLPFYLNAWKTDQGEVNLLEKRSDDDLPGIRFVAEGGLYKTWSNLIVSGNEGWCIYAGVHRNAPVNEPELEQAERAKESTRVGVE